MTAPTKARILETLSYIKDKETQKNLVEQGLIADVHISDGAVRLVLELTPETMKGADALKSICAQEIKGIPGVHQVEILLTSHRSKADKKTQSKSPHPVAEKLDLPHLKNIIAVTSGKGGVGKSLVAVNLAFALAAQGLKVGLLDLDIYGPSLPLMSGLSEQPEKENGQFIPLEKDGVKLLSMGFLIPPEKATIWRGPLVQMAVQQLLRDTKWGDLDVLVLDTPPGTGDVHLTLTQSVDLTGAILVTTPQELALIDARKSYDMFQTVGVPVLGMVENMGHFQCPHCHKETPLFDKEGGKRDANKLQIPLLAEIPLDQKIRESADQGIILASSASASPYKEVFMNMAEKIKRLL